MLHKPVVDVVLPKGSKTTDLLYMAVIFYRGPQSLHMCNKVYLK